MTAVLKGVLAYFIFLLSWVVVFSFAYLVLGNEIKNKDWCYMGISYRYFMHTWAMSTGGGPKPVVEEWFKYKNDVERNVNWDYLMVFLNWIN